MAPPRPFTALKKPHSTCSSDQSFPQDRVHKTEAVIHISGNPGACIEVMHQLLSEELLGKKQPTKKLMIPQLFKDRRNQSLSCANSEMRVLAALRGLSDILVQNVGKSPRNSLAFKHCSRFWGVFVFFFSTGEGTQAGAWKPSNTNCAGSSLLYKDTQA